MAFLMCRIKLVYAILSTAKDSDKLRELNVMYFNCLIIMNCAILVFESFGRKECGWGKKEESWFGLEEVRVKCFGHT